METDNRKKYYLTEKSVFQKKSVTYLKYYGSEKYEITLPVLL